MELRPHHLLCIRAYRGKGYNEEFVENMNRIITRINNDNNLNIKIKFAVDEVCEFCINKIANSKCSTNEKVNIMDGKVKEYFNIKEGNYSFKELNNYIDKIINEEIIYDMCSNCEWYENSNCRNYILESIIR